MKKKASIFLLFSFSVYAEDPNCLEKELTPEAVLLCEKKAFIEDEIYAQNAQKTCLKNFLDYEKDNREYYDHLGPMEKKDLIATAKKNCVENSLYVRRVNNYLKCSNYLKTNKSPARECTKYIFAKCIISLQNAKESIGTKVNFCSSEIASTYVDEMSGNKTSRVYDDYRMCLKKLDESNKRLSFYEEEVNDKNNECGKSSMYRYQEEYFRCRELYPNDDSWRAFLAPYVCWDDPGSRHFYHDNIKSCFRILKSYGRPKERAQYCKDQGYGFNSVIMKIKNECMRAFNKTSERESKVVRDKLFRECATSDDVRAAGDEKILKCLKLKDEGLSSCVVSSSLCYSLIDKKYPKKHNDLKYRCVDTEFKNLVERMSESFFQCVKEIDNVERSETQLGRAFEICTNEIVLSDPKVFASCMKDKNKNKTDCLQESEKILLKN